MRVTFPIIRTLAYAVLVFFMWRFVGMEALRFDAKLSFTLPGWTTAIGIPLLIAGVVLTTICLAEFALIGKGHSYILIHQKNLSHRVYTGFQEIQCAWVCC